MPWLEQSLPPAVTVVVVIAAVLVVRRVLTDREQRFSRGVTLTIVWILGALAIVLSLPIEPGLRGQLVGLLGVVLSAAIALGSTTLIAQALAGVMLKVGRTFRRGDFIQVNDHFGRVTVRALFHTEIQTETRDLLFLPNLYLATNPVRVIQSTGTIITADVGLGYDVPLSQVEDLARSAAEEAELGEPFLLVTELGDFAVVYRVGGLLADPRRLISTRSTLRKQLLRKLHDADIEIASPNLVSQRVFPAEHRFMFKPVRDKSDADEHTPEATAFDKADQAESLEKSIELRESVRAQIAEAKGRLADAEGDEKDAMTARIEQLTGRLARIEEVIERQRRSLDN